MHTTFADIRHLLGRYLSPLRWRTALLGVLLVVGIALQLTGPQLLQRFIDHALAGDAVRGLVVLAVTYLAIALVTQAVGLIELQVATNVGLLATNAVRNDLALHALRLDASFHHTHPPGNLIERVDGDVTNLGNFFSRFIVEILGSGLLGLGVLVMIARVDWRAGLIIGTFAVVAIVVINAMRNIATTAYAADREASADLYGYIEERLGGTEDIRSAGATDYVMRGNHLRARTLRQARLRGSMLGSFSYASASLIFAVGSVVSLATGVWLFNTGEISVGTVFLMYQYTALLSQPIGQLSRQMQDLQQAGASVGRIDALFRERPGIVDGPGASPNPAVAARVAFDDVSFAYDSGPTVLEDIGFCLEPGQVLGLVGHTGSGKTSVARLLTRLHDPTSGQVVLGDCDLRSFTIDELRQRIGLVTQDIQLFHASLRDNLTLFDPTIDDARIIRAIDDVGLGSWLGTLPEGLDTVLATVGGGLSAGEAQLLAFARIFIGDPDVVVLDEASSRLDPITERRLERAIDRLLANRTAIVIAHRLTTVARADLIMVLDSGRMVEFGPRADLAGDPTSRFAGLIRAGQDIFAAGEHP